MGAGINPGVSIGFIPIESRNATKGDRAKYGDGVQTVHSKWKLLELSIAPVQANQEAVVVAVGKALETGKQIIVPPRKTFHFVSHIKRNDPDAARKAAHRIMLKEFGQVYA